LSAFILRKLSIKKKRGEKINGKNNNTRGKQKTTARTRF
jgi:hypothetical protein